MNLKWFYIITNIVYISAPLLRLIISILKWERDSDYEANEKFVFSTEHPEVLVR